jgi:hypothetical protein
MKNKVKSMLIVLFDIKGIVLPGSLNSQFRILLWSFAETERKSATTSPRTLATKERAVASRQRNIPHSFFVREFFYQKQHDCNLHAP